MSQSCLLSQISRHDPHFQYISSKGSQSPSVKLDRTCHVSLLPEEEMIESEDSKGWKTRLVPRVVFSVLINPQRPI